MGSELALILVHPEAEMAEAFRRRFAGLPGVETVVGRFENLPPLDGFVTAGNAFGIMTAGIDAAVVARCGPHLMRAVQRRILDEYRGEQPVGTAFVEEVGADFLKYLVHAPTMRVPGGIDGTDKVYLSTWAALLAVHAHNRLAAASRGETAAAVRPTPIRTLGLPAMGTGFGGVPFDEAARQMAAAYRHFLFPPVQLDWDVVVARQKAILYDGSRQAAR